MKKITGILVNDIHLNKTNSSLIKDIFIQLIDICKERGIKRIFCGGDVFTNRSGQPLQCLISWMDILEELTKAELELHVIPGNHDKTDSDDESSFLDIYSNACCHLYRKATCKKFGKCTVAFVPYFTDEKWLEEFREIEDEVDYSKPSFLITHSGFDGVMNNDGSAVSSIIKPDMFSNFSKVLIGHYHDSSSLADNVFYTGSAYQNNYGENITDKGFTILFNDGSTEFVPSKFPKYIKEVIQANDKMTLMNLLEKYEGEEHDHIRFLFIGKKTDCEKINITQIQTEYGIDCKCESIESSEAIEISESESVLSYDKKTVKKDFLKFCADNEIKGGDFKYGFDLIKQMKNVESDKN